MLRASAALADPASVAQSPAVPAAASSPTRLPDQLDVHRRYSRCRQLRRTLYGETALYRDAARGGKLVVLKRVSVRAVEADAEATHENPLRERAVIQLLDQYDHSAPRLSAAASGRAHIINFEREALFPAGPDDVCLAMEFCAGGDLYDHVSKAPQRRLGEREALAWVGEIALGLRFLHSSLGVAHRDVSLENVLLDGGHAKICDFGLSTAAGAKSSEVVGKFYYMAPEVLSASADEPYDPRAADVWSLGVLLFIMLTGSPLFAETRAREPTLRVLAKYGVTKVLELWGLGRSFSRFTVNLLACMLQVRPEHRLTMDEVVRHPALRRR